jgi:glutaredoxin
MPKLLMISLSTCPVCNEVEKKIKERKLDIKRLDVDKNAVAKEIATNLGITAVPQIVIYDEKEKKACLVKFEGGKPKIEKCTLLKGSELFKT